MKPKMGLKTALLIVDMQNDFVLPTGAAPIPSAFETIPAVKETLSFFRAQKLPVFHIIRQYRLDGSDIEISRQEAFLNGPQYVVPGTKGAEIIEELTPVPGEYTIIKPRFSAFFGTELELILRRLGIEQLAICGTQYPNCIRATAYDALSYGYRTFIICEATSAASPEVAHANIRDLQNVGIPCLPLGDFKKKLGF